jgi:hypothetical protein
MLHEGVARNAVDRSILPQSPIAVVVPITDAIWGVYHRPGKGGDPGLGAELYPAHGECPLDFAGESTGFAWLTVNPDP